MESGQPSPLEIRSSLGKVTGENAPSMLSTLCL
jgi:hypothetical protein